MFTGIGVTVSYFISYGMSFTTGSIAWRLPISLQLIPCVLVSILLIGLPETPRYLIQTDNVEDAITVLCQVFGAEPDDEYVQQEKNNIIHALEIENQTPFQWRHIFRKDRVQTGKRVLLACFVLTCNQVREPSFSAIALIPLG
jgi:hypothetical protein